MDIALRKPIAREREMIHEEISIRWWPDQPESIYQGVERNNSIPNIVLWKAIKQVAQVAVKVLVEIALRYRITEEVSRCVVCLSAHVVRQRTKSLLFVECISIY